MGQFLTTGLIREFSIGKWTIEKLTSIDQDKFIDTFASKLISNPKAFIVKENENQYVWSLKPEVFENYLHDLLKKYFKAHFSTILRIK